MRSYAVALIALAAIATLAPGCSWTRDAVESAASVALPPSEEVALGAEAKKQLEAEVRLLADPVVNDYVAGVGQSLARQADLPGPIEATYQVIDDDGVVNAVALPGGHIYVYTGLLRLMDDGAELAAVLAHETAHVAERHVAERLAAMFGLQLLQEAAFGESPGLVAQIVSAVASGGLLLSYTREQEAVADAVGLGYEVAAGFDPQGAVQLFQKLGGMESTLPTFLLSHPLAKDRVAALQAQIARLPRPPTRADRAQYQQVMARLPAVKMPDEKAPMPGGAAPGERPRP